VYPLNRLPRPPRAMGNGVEERRQRAEAREARRVLKEREVAEAVRQVGESQTRGYGLLRMQAVAQVRQETRGKHANTTLQAITE
jgi:hypothetical protein